MKILFVGDLFFGGDLQTNPSDLLIQSDFFSEADVRIANLEQSISEGDSTIEKSALFSNASVVPFVKKMNFSALNIANNHIHDKGSDGILDTIKYLDHAEIKHFGAGKNISEAKKPFWIDEKICIIGYCEYEKSYLDQVQIANKMEPGVNPLRLASILEDLSKLPEGSTAILFFHWGREHTWFPPIEDLQLAKKLLEHDKVLMIIGTHSHRIQGYIEHNGKHAYMSLGNFLFPNFFIQPPNEVGYPKTIPEKYAITRLYHRVNELTYKKWKRINRISLMVSFNLDTKLHSHQFAYQEDDNPRISTILGWSRLYWEMWFIFLSWIYKTPTTIYIIIESLSKYLTIFTWYFGISLFYFRNYGIKWTFNYYLLKFRK